MKIVFIITRSDEIGGAHINVRDMALFAIEQGHDVSVLVGGRGIFFDLLMSLGLNVVSIGSLQRSIHLLRDIKAMYEIKYWIERLSPDIVAVHSAKVGFLCRLLYSRRISYKIVFTAHGWSFGDGVKQPARSLYWFLEKLLSDRCERIICVCHSDARLAFGLSVAKRHQLSVIYNGVHDYSCHSTTLKKSAPGPARLICVARFEAQKDHRTLLIALSELAHLAWSLTLVGNGPLLHSCIQLTQDLGINNRVYFAGRSYNPSELLRESDIMLLPSNWEGFPLTILEAMSHSLPVIATDVGGVSESVIENFNGLLVPPQDYRSWKSKLSLLILDDALRLRLGSNGRRLYSSCFTFQEMAKSTLDLYSTLLSQ